MLNLLPESERKSLRRGYLLRLVAVALFLLAAAFAAGGVLLLPAYFAARADQAAAVRTLALLERSREISSAEEAGALLGAARRKTEHLAASLGRTSVADLLRRIVAARNSSVALSGFSFEEREGGAWVAGVRGTAAAREALLDFVRRLERDRAFQAVDLPVSNLAGDSDIAFSITLSGSYP